jgi:hypothetical protein
MSLWGNKDSKTTVGTCAVTTAGAVTGASSAVLTNYKVGDFLRVGANDYVFTAIADASNATVRSATGSTTIPASSAAAYEVSEKPLSTVYSENIDAASIYGADTTEVGITGEGKSVAHAGWVKRTPGTGGRNGRVQYETLVAMGSISGDAADDTPLPDSE